MCSSYDTVDVYFFGHGFEGNYGLYGYCCYDGVDSYGTFYPSNYYYANELQSYGTHYYDYSALRLGKGGFCYSGAFRNYFLNEGSVWIGSRISNGGDIPAGVPILIYVDYMVGYTAYWGYYWYYIQDNSVNSHSQANTAGVAYLNLGADIGGFDHYSGMSGSIYN